MKSICIDPLIPTGIIISDEFTAHGIYTVSNAIGYEVQLSECGDMARLRHRSDGSDVSEWFEIIYVTDEDGQDCIPVIDPDGYNIPLNEVMRVR